MQFLDLTLATLPENLALDEAFLLEAEDGGGEVLRFWEWPQPAVVLGAAGRIAEDVDEAACQRDGVPIFRRSSGGGTVLLGPGCLVFTLVLSYGRAPELADIRSSYRFILGRISEALSDVAPGLEIAGTSDMAVGGRKVSGNSQQRKRQHLLHHGTLLYGFDLGQVGRYLKLPSRQPDYRQEREHAAFLTNLPAGAEVLKCRIRDSWKPGVELATLRSAARRVEAMVQALVHEKYLTSAWIRRR